MFYVTSFLLLPKIGMLHLSAKFFHSFVEIFTFMHTVWKNKIFTDKIFREMDSLGTSSVKVLLSRNFFQNSVRVIFHVFHTVFN